MEKTKFSLRAFNKDDAVDFHALINTPKIAADTTIPLPWNYDHIVWWIGFITEAAKKTPKSEQHFVIEIDGKLQGSVALINIDGHKGEIGYWLDQKYAGQGLMTAAIDQVTDYAFKELKLARIFAPVLPHNVASGRVLEKNGFIKEGILRNYYFKDGKYVNALAYAKIDG